MLAILAALLVGGLLRVWQINESLWLDELHTAWVAAGSIGDVLPRAHAGNQSPLYFYGVWLLTQLLGQHEWVVRLPSVVAGTALIPVIGIAVWRLTHSEHASVLAALLVALDRDCVFYATEARPYALVQLVAVVHGLIFLTVCRRPRPLARMMLIGGAAVLFYLHYTTSIFLAAELVCWALLAATRCSQLNYRWRHVLVDCAAVIVLILPAVPHVLWVARHRDNWARMISPWPSAAIQFQLMTYVLLPVMFLLVGVVWRSIGPASRSAAVDLSAGGDADQDAPTSVDGHAADVRSTTTVADSARQSGFVWSVCWWSVPLIVAWLSTVFGIAALWMLRYVVASLVGMIAFAGVCAARLPSGLARWLLSGVLIVSSLAYGNMLQQWQASGRFIADRMENWAAAARYLQTHNRHSHWPVLLMAGLLEDRELATVDDPALRAYCAFPLTGTYAIRDADVVPLSSVPVVRLNQRDVDAVAQYSGMWLVVRSGPQGARRRVDSLRDELRRHGIEVTVTDEQQFGRLVVFRMTRS